MSNRTFKDLKNRSSISAPFNKPNQFKVEGEDHINISLQSKTKLGRLLDPGYCMNLEYPHIGKFKSVLALGYWLRSEDLDDTIRTLSGSKLKQYAKDHDLYSKRVPNYTAIVAKATWLRVSSREDIIEEIKNLPDNIDLLSYSIHKTSNLRITTNYAPMVVAITKEIIRAVKANSEPNLDMFIQDASCAGMDYLEGVLSRHKVAATQD